MRSGLPISLNSGVVAPSRARHAVRHTLAMLALWHGRASQRRALLELDAERLADLGLTADEVATEARKPFWRR